MRVEPIGDDAQPRKTISRLAGAAQLVILSVKDAKPRLDPVRFQSGEHLEGLIKLAAEVVGRVNEQRRR